MLELIIKPCKSTSSVLTRYCDTKHNWTGSIKLRRNSFQKVESLSIPSFFQLLAPYLTPFCKGSNKRSSGHILFSCAVLTSHNIKEFFFFFPLTETRFSTKTGPCIWDCMSEVQFSGEKNSQNQKKGGGGGGAEKKRTLAAGCKGSPENWPRKSP